MTEKTGLRVAGIAGSLDKLVHYIPVEGVPVLPGTESPGILGIERKSHIQSVKPYLVRVYLLVPELSALCTRLGVKLPADLAQHTPVFLVPCHKVQVKIYPRRTYMVQIVVFKLVAIHLPLIGSHRVRPVTYIVHCIRKIVTMRHIEERFQFQSGRIVPLPVSLTAIQPSGIRIAEHLAHHHLH